MSKRLIPILLAAALLAGCASRHEPEPMPILTEPVVQEPEPQDNPGSLFTPNTATYLFDDDRAHRVGDIVMVVVSEVSYGKQKISTTSDSKNTNDMSIKVLPDDGWMGKAVDTIGIPSGIGTSKDNSLDSSGETKHEATLTATVASRVIRLLPGGVLQVEGARRIRLNDETQILVVRGLVRPSDVAADNTVPSAHLAEAQIELYGEGVISDRQKFGWLNRILDNIWPF
ncbi:MAG: flagellar basal body L-ring protein FlgH [Desulfovibrionaceae bacterium]